MNYIIKELEEVTIYFNNNWNLLWVERTI